MVVSVNLLLVRELTFGFDLAFVAVCLFAAFSVRPRDFFVVGVLPPLLMFATVLALAKLKRGAIAEETDGVVQAVVSGLAHHAGALVVGYGLVLGILAVRQVAEKQNLPAQRRQRSAARG